MVGIDLTAELMLHRNGEQTGNFAVYVTALCIVACHTQTSPEGIGDTVQMPEAQGHPRDEMPVLAEA
jgi:hypothetical protein